MERVACHDKELAEGGTCTYGQRYIKRRIHIGGDARLGDGGERYLLEGAISWRELHTKSVNPRRMLHTGWVIF